MPCMHACIFIINNEVTRRTSLRDYICIVDSARYYCILNFLFFSSCCVVLGECTCLADGRHLQWQDEKVMAWEQRS